MPDCRPFCRLASGLRHWLHFDDVDEGEDVEANVSVDVDVDEDGAGRGRGCGPDRGWGLAGRCLVSGMAWSHC